MSIYGVPIHDMLYVSNLINNRILFQEYPNHIYNALKIGILVHNGIMTQAIYNEALFYTRFHYEVGSESAPVNPGYAMMSESLEFVAYLAETLIQIASQAQLEEHITSNSRLFMTGMNDLIESEEFEPGGLNFLASINQEILSENYIYDTN